VSVAT
jgi:hypothetical protein